MVGWTEYKNHSRDRGSLALELFAVISQPVGSPEAIKEVLPDHLAYQAKLETAGVLALAGPLSGLSGENMEGEGLIIYRAASLADARKLAGNDPMHLTGVRSFTIRAWLVNEGTGIETMPSLT